MGEETPENKTDSGIAERIRVFEGEGLEPGGGVWSPWTGLDRTRRRLGCHYSDLLGLFRSIFLIVSVSSGPESGADGERGVGHRVQISSPTSLNVSPCGKWARVQFFILLPALSTTCRRESLHARQVQGNKNTLKYRPESTKARWNPSPEMGSKQKAAVGIRTRGEEQGGVQPEVTRKTPELQPLEVDCVSTRGTAHSMSCNFHPTSNDEATTEVVSVRDSLPSRRV